MLYQTCAHTHLGNISRNIRSIRAAVGPDCLILAAVKANAYGHGAVEVSRAAAEAGADWLGIATVPEGIQLREAGIELPLLKFSPVFPEELNAALENRITLTVCDEESVRLVQQGAAALGLTADVHMKVDTGMGRIGVSIEAAPALADYIEHGCDAVNLEGVYTHLPVSDEKDPDYTEAQIERFKGVVDQVTARIGRRPPIVHCANSGAVLAHPNGWLDMVRPGIMIYGCYPDKETPRTIELLSGMSVTTSVSFLKKIKKGTSVGYGRTWTAPGDCWIATIPVGYADGYNRLFSNRARVLINGRSYPLAGRVCMDQSMVNLGAETAVSVGDEVVLMGKSGAEEIRCDEWADLMGTITYEVTCNIGSRVERLYD